MKHLSRPRTNTGPDMSLDVKSCTKILDLPYLRSVAARLPKAGFMIFLHQNCTTRLRSLGRASAKYSVRGEPVTFFAVLRTLGTLQHHWENLVKPAAKKAPEPRFHTVFTSASGPQKNNRSVFAVCARLLH